MTPVKTIIPAFHVKKVFKKDVNTFLKVSEFFFDSIQGEGICAGHPAAFLRLQGCTLGCSYCDTTAVWKSGNAYNFTELLQLIKSSGLLSKLSRSGEEQHFIITGGSPLLQQERLILFLQSFFNTFGFLPFIEIENECTVLPEQELIDMVSLWSNSPKLSSSGVEEEYAYKPAVIRKMASLRSSWFKFVITKREDWNEIVEKYLHTGLIKKEKIILMPEANSREELIQNSPAVAELAIMEGVRFTSREHILLWDKKVGV